MVMVCVSAVFFCFKQKTAYEVRISDWSSDVCSSDLFAIATFRMRTGDIKCGAPVVRILKVAIANAIVPQDTVRHLTGEGRCGIAGARCGTQIGRASCRDSVGQYV